MHRVRKTLFMGFRKCPQQGMYMFRDRDNESYGDVNWEVEALAKGQIFHHTAEDFWSTMCKVEDIVGDEDDIRDYFISLMPKTHVSDLRKWFRWYAKYESERFIKMREEGKLEYFKPFMMEEAIEAEIEGLIRTGHFDRIDRVSENELIIVEYKTGFSYDPSKEYAMSNVRSEVQWYRSIIEKLDKFEKYTVVGWKMINPTVERVVGGKFSPLTKHAVNKAADKIIKFLDGEEDPIKKYGPYCAHCDWMDECIGYKEEGHEIFGLLSKEMKGVGK